MSLKNALKSQICRFHAAPDYPVNEFVQWACGQAIPSTQMLQELDELQKQLDIEAEALRRHTVDREALITQQECWCLYCEQIRAHYRVILREPEEVH